MSDTTEPKLNPCGCGGKMELLNDQRHMKQRVSRERFELVCADCGLTVNHPNKSTHKLIAAWNTRQPDNELVEENNKLVTQNAHVMGLNKVFAEENRKLKAELDGFKWRQHD